MRDPELVARAGYAAARLEQAWERWRALHGLSGSADPLASYVGYSLKEPMGQPRVVIGVDAAEAEFFADFLESHDCAAPGAVSGPMHQPVSGPQRVLANGSTRPSGPAVASGPVGAGPADAQAARAAGPAGAPAPRNAGPGPAPAPRDVPSEPMVRLVDGADSGSLPGPLSAPVTPLSPAPPNGGSGYAGHSGPLERAEYPGPGEPPAPQEPPDAMAAELAGWASGELPGQASEQLASWVAGDSGGRRLRRSRSAS
jgi:hypothetical protein